MASDASAGVEYEPISSLSLRPEAKMSCRETVCRPEDDERT
jgi:hypothetical protein